MKFECAECAKPVDRKLGEVNRSGNKRFFCSHTCSGSFNGRLRVRKGKMKICQQCEAEYEYKNHKPSARFCASCFQQKQLETKRITLGDVAKHCSVRGKHPSWRWAYVRTQARTIHSDLLSLPCRECGYSKHVELAHVKPISSFEDSALLSEVNARANVSQLCRNCHWEFDHGLLILK